MRHLTLTTLVAVVLMAAADSAAMGQVLANLHSFAGGRTDGASSYGGLILATDGNFYGVTFGGGAHFTGTIFKATPSGSVRVIHSFGPYDGNVDGIYPFGMLLQGPDGALYGTATEGGAGSSGTIFRITLSGAFTVLHSFGLNGVRDGRDARDGLLLGQDGMIYGSTDSGGQYGWGTLFKLSPGMAFTSLYSFNGTDGQFPSSLIQAADGYLYGTAYGGGTGGRGIVFRVTPGGALTTLHNFSPTSPQSPYPNSDGAGPGAALVQCSDGDLYGVTVAGGAYGNGVVFKVTPDGVFTKLHDFDGAEGAFPVAPLVQTPDGDLYGTTLLGGQNNNGAIYRLAPDGALTGLYAFSRLSPSGNTDGAWPRDALTIGPGGKLYGTTSIGGASDRGSVIALDPGIPAPVIESLHPGYANSASTGLTVTLFGAHFTSDLSVAWNGADLITTVVSPDRLRALVPAALVNEPRTAQITLINGQGGVSLGKNFGVVLTTLAIAMPRLTRNPETGAIIARIALTNTGNKSATYIELTKAFLGSTPATSALPRALGTVAAGASRTLSLTFPEGAAPPGTTAELRLVGFFTAGTFTPAQLVSVP